MSNTARGIIFKCIAEVAGISLNVITFSMIVKYVGAAGYGAYSQVNAIIGFLIPFASMGLGSSIVRFFSVQPWNEFMRKRLTRLIMFVAAVSIAFSIGIFLCAPALNKLFLKWDKGAQIFQWGSLLVAIGAIDQVTNNFLRAKQRLIYISIIQLAQVILIAAATFTLLSSGHDVLDLVRAIVGIKALIIFLVIAGFWLWDKPGSDSLKEGDFDIFKLIKFGLPLTIASFGLWLMNLGDRLVIGHFMHPEALGLYGAVYSLAFMMTLVNIPLNLPLYPRLMHVIASKDAPGLSREINIFSRYAILILVPSAIFLLLIIRPFLYFTGGHEFTADYLLISFIVLSIFIEQMSSISQYILACIDGAVFSQNMWLLAGVTNFVLNIFAVPLAGLRGAAFVTLITFFILNLIFFLKANKEVPFARHIHFSAFWKSLISGCISGAVLFIMITIFKFNFINLIISAIAFSVTYVLSMIVLKGIHKEDFNLITKAFSINFQI